MKLCVGLLALMTSTAWASSVLPFPEKQFPLQLCNNVIGQAYNITGSDSITDVRFSGYTSSGCSNLDSTADLAGTVNVSASDLSFNLCLNTSTGAWRTTLCQISGLTGSTGTGYVRITVVALGGGGVKVTNGNCIEVTCTSGQATNWTSQSSATLDLT